LIRVVQPFPYVILCLQFPPCSAFNCSFLLRPLPFSPCLPLSSQLSLLIFVLLCLPQFMNRNSLGPDPEIVRSRQVLPLPDPLLVTSESGPPPIYSLFDTSGLLSLLRVLTQVHPLFFPMSFPPQNLPPPRPSFVPGPPPFSARS